MESYVGSAVAASFSHRHVAVPLFWDRIPESR